MKKVLMVAYQFPPMGGSGVQRTTKFVKYLPEFEYEPIVFTRENKNTELKDSTLMKDIPRDLDIIRTKPYDFTELPGILKLFGKVINRKILIPDGERVWQLLSKKKAEDYIEKNNVDIIYTTSYPYSDHLLGLHLKKKYPNIPWVVDFRDEWTNNPYLLDSPHYNFRMNLEKEMEKEVLTMGDYLITNTPIMMENFIKTYPFTKDKFNVIPNGYDEEDFKGMDRQLPENDKMTITYTGSFYGRRKPDIFFKALQELINEKKINKSDIKINLVGNYKVKVIENMINENNLNGIVEIYDYMEHKESIKMLMQSDCLLLIIGSGRGAEAFYTGKIFEYMYTGRPILALVPEKGVAADVIRKTETGCVADSRDLNKIKENVMKLYQNWLDKNNDFTPNWDKIKRFDRKELTKKLSNVFDNALDNFQGRQR